MFDYTPGFHVFGNYNSGNAQALVSLAQQSEEMFKSLQTGEGVVLGGATGGQTLRVQYLHNVLEQVSYEQDDAQAIKAIPKEKVYSNTFEYSIFQQYGGPGSNFVAENGSDGQFNVTTGDDNYLRQVRLLKYIAALREVSVVAQTVRNIANPEQTAERGATLEIIGKANAAIYFGDSRKCTVAWDGIESQILQWVTSYPNDAEILMDAGGQPMDKFILGDACAIARNHFGKISLMLSSVAVKNDLMKSIYPEQRTGEGVLAALGLKSNVFESNDGPVAMKSDPFLRVNRPLVAEGNGSNGLPRTSSTADAGSLAFASTPYIAASGANGIQAASPGTGNYWQNANLNTDTAILGTLPALPAPPYVGSQNNSANRLAAGSYYIAIAPVYNGLEGQAWVYGASSAGTVSGATALTPTAGQVIQMDVDLTTPCITGLGSTYGLNMVWFRIYRYGGPGATAPVSLSQFQYLDDVACPTSGNARYVDNGYKMPGTETVFLITEKKNGANGWFMAQLLPLMRRMGLPAKMLSDPIGLLWFAAPILLAQRHHILVRNVGRYK